MPPRRAALLVLLAAVLLLSGCEIKASLVLKDDGTGTFSYVVGIDKSFLARMDPGADPLGTMRRNAEDQNYEVHLEEYETQKLKGLKASFAFTSIPDLKAKLASNKPGAGAGAAAAAAYAFDVLDLVRIEDGWKLNANAAIASRAEQQLPFDRAELDKVLDAEFSATLPGRAGRHNATRVSRGDGGTTFTWDLLAGEGNLSLQAETTSEDDSFPTVTVVTLAVLVLGAAGFFLLRRSKATSSST